MPSQEMKKEVMSIDSVIEEEEMMPPIETEIQKENPQRLVIDKIELVNFKSYKGKKVIGPFHKSFNTVVGPNGSGKSNFLESLIFVFGKRATKMRMKSIKEAINSDKKITKARVEVYFKIIEDFEDSPDDYEDVPHSGFRVAREVN
jgi:structural maintenance of chromosome 4